MKQRKSSPSNPENSKEWGLSLLCLSTFGFYCPSFFENDSKEIEYCIIQGICLCRESNVSYSTRADFCIWNNIFEFRRALFSKLTCESVSGLLGQLLFSSMDLCLDYVVHLYSNWDSVLYN